MTRGRLLALLLVLQLLATLILTQTWFSIAMVLNGNPTTLGEYDGATTYAIAMPVNLLSLALLGVALLTRGLTTRILLAVLALVAIANGIFLMLQVLARNVSGLDSQLERLTGIAKTHGISDLQISTSAFPWIWLTVTILITLIAGYGTAVGRIWTLKALRQTKPTARAAKLDPISLWEDQRS